MMNRLTSFLLGVLVGAFGLGITMHYYIVHASDGLHWVPKLAAKLEVPYVDIRKFTVEDWQRHQGLAMSILKSNKGQLMQDSTLDNFRRASENLLQQLIP